jgi:hypothetical protein
MNNIVVYGTLCRGHVHNFSHPSVTDTMSPRSWTTLFEEKTDKEVVTVWMFALSQT